MIGFGLGFVLLGVLGELFGGTYFRHLLDWRYPPAKVRHDDVRIKVLGFRMLLLIGFVLVVAGGASWLLRDVL